MAAGDILGATVLGAAPHNGWAIEIEIEGWAAQIGSIVYDLGYDAGTLPTAATPKLTVVSEGFNAAATLGTITRTVWLGKQVRQAYPNQAVLAERTSGGNLIVTVSLTDPVYDDDKAGGAGTSGTDPVIDIPAGVFNNGSGDNAAAVGLAVTNNSALDYPKPWGKWTWPCWRLVDSDFAVELSAQSRFARNGKPVACVEFYAADESSNTAGPIRVTEETISPRGSAGGPVPIYEGEIPISSFAQGDVIEVTAKIYPWIGDVPFDLALDADGADPWESPHLPGPQYYVCDKSGGFGRSWAVVSTTGNDGTGAVSGVSEAAASANPFATAAGALAALIAYNNSNYGRATAEGSTVAFQDGNHNWPGTVSGLTWGGVRVIFKLADGASAATFTNASQNQQFDGQVEVHGMGFDSSAVGLLRGWDDWTRIWIDAAPVFEITNTAPIYELLEFQITNSVIGSVNGGFAHFSSNASPCTLFRGNTLTEQTRVPPYCIIGNVGPVRIFDGAAETYRPAADGGIVSHNDGMVTGETWWYSGGWEITIGLAQISNLIEAIGMSSQPLISAYADSNGAATSQIIFAGNTLMGQRLNLLYNDTGATPFLHKNQRISGNLVWEFNIKTDTFAPANGGRTGNWAPLYGVGFAHNHAVQNSGGGFEPEFPGIGRTTGAPGVVYDASDTSGDGTGGGDYTPDTGSPLKARVPAIDQYSRFDVLGNERADGGDIGAIETTQSGVVHDLVVQSVSAGLAAGQPALTAALMLGTSPAAFALAAGALTLTGAGNLAVQGGRMTFIASRPALLTTTSLAAKDLYLAFGPTHVAVTTDYVLSVEAALIAAGCGHVDLSGTASLTVAALGLALGVADLTLTGAGELVLNDINLAVALSEIELAGTSGLTPRALALALGCEVATLSSAESLALASLGLPVSADNLTLAGSGALITQPVGLALEAGPLALTAAVLLTVHPAVIAFAYDLPQISASTAVVIQGLTLSLGGEEIDLGAAADLIVQGLGLTPTASGVSLTAAGALTVQDADIVMAAEALTLSAAVALSVDPAGIAVAVDAPTLASLAVLSVDDLAAELGIADITLVDAFIVLPAAPSVTILPDKRAVTIVPVYKSIRVE